MAREQGRIKCMQVFCTRKLNHRIHHLGPTLDILWNNNNFGKSENLYQLLETLYECFVCLLICVLKQYLHIDESILITISEPHQPKFTCFVCTKPYSNPSHTKGPTKQLSCTTDTEAPGWTRQTQFCEMGYGCILRSMVVVLGGSVGPVK